MISREEIQNCNSQVNMQIHLCIPGEPLHSLSCCFFVLLFSLPPSTNWSFSCLFYTGTDDGIYYRSQVITTQCQQCGSWTYNKFKMNRTHVHLRANYRFIIRNNCMQQKIYQQTLCVFLEYKHSLLWPNESWSHTHNAFYFSVKGKLNYITRHWFKPPKKWRKYGKWRTHTAWISFSYPTVKPEAWLPTPKCVWQPAGLLEGNLQDGQWQLFIFSLIDLNSPLYNVK